MNKHFLENSAVGEFYIGSDSWESVELRTNIVLNERENQSVYMAVRMKKIEIKHIRR